MKFLILCVHVTFCQFSLYILVSGDISSLEMLMQKFIAADIKARVHESLRQSSFFLDFRYVPLHYFAIFVKLCQSHCLSILCLNSSVFIFCCLMKRETDDRRTEYDNGNGEIGGFLLPFACLCISLLKKGKYLKMSSFLLSISPFWSLNPFLSAYVNLVCRFAC